MQTVFPEDAMLAFLEAHAYLIAQIFGFSAMGTAILTYQFNKQKTLNLLLMLVAALWCLHYAALGLLTPIMMNVINVVRAFIYSKRDKKWANHNVIPALFCIAAVVMVILTWENAWSLLPCVASISASVGNWQTDTKKLRLLTVPVCLCWGVYNFVNGSVAGVANESFTLISLIVAFIRYDRKKPGQTEQNK